MKNKMKQNLPFFLFLLFYINAQSQPLMSIIDTLDYGCIMVGSNPNREFPVYNIGDEPLIITNAQGSSGAVVPTFPRDPIAPGDSAIFKIRYNTNVIGPFCKTVTITTNEDTTRIIKVLGEVKETTSINENSRNSNLDIRYNSNTGNLSINLLSTHSNETYLINLININGQVLYSEQVKLPAQVYMGNFPNGQYIFQAIVKRKNEMVIKKIQKYD